MTEEYGIRKAETREILPEIDLLPQIPHKGQQLDMALFGTNTYRSNIQNMLKAHFHSKELSNITFTPATTTSSISAASYGFKDFVKPQILDTNWLQAGWILKTSEGVFVNPLDTQRNPITDEQILKSYLKADRKVNGIYLLDNEMGFAPYDSFERGVQDCDTFAQGGLARVLEHTPEKVAEQLRAIASPKFYKIGVDVWGFDSVKEPILRVVGLYSYWLLDGRRLHVGGDDWVDYYYGFAFGVLRTGEASAPEK